MKILGVIPARYASTRFPGKMLADIAGKSMVQRVFERVSQSKVSQVLIATDDERIKKAAERFGALVVMTNANHPSGTDRCYEAAEKMNGQFDYVMNIQGDEPFIDPEQINQLIGVLDGKTEIATLIRKTDDAALVMSPDEAKVVLNNNKEAIYFSRSPIPFVRGKKPETWHLETDCYHHIGLYAYRSDVLRKITGLPPGKLEMAESLEQLRWIENGLKIKTVETELTGGFCVEQPKDLPKAVAYAMKLGI